MYCYNEIENFGTYCLTPYEVLLRVGINWLQEDLQKSEPYIHDKPKGDYAEKNEYFNRANVIGFPLLKLGITGLSKMYYWHLLNQINEFEKISIKSFNKGMVCANLGVSSLAEGDFDGGIAYLLWAGQEDRGWSGDAIQNVFSNPLYGQFADGTHRNGKSQFGSLAPWKMIRQTIKKFNTDFYSNLTLEQVFKEMESSPEHRSLFEGSIWVIHRNLKLLREENERSIYTSKNNLYTRLRLYDGFISLCRFIELRMRYYNNISGPLGKLLEHSFKKEKWFKREVQPYKKECKNSYEFNRKISDILNNYTRPSKNILLLWVLRNYATHLCDPETPNFFMQIENIFDEVIIAYFFYLDSYVFT